MADDKQQTTPADEATDEKAATGETAVADDQDQVADETPEAQADEAQQDETEDDAPTSEDSDDEDSDDEGDLDEDADDEEEGEDDTDDEDSDDEDSDDEDRLEPARRSHEVTIEQLLKAGAHFGHLTSRWHPRMEKYIFMDRNNIHIIDLMQTQVLLDRAADAAERFAKRGKEILFVGTKKQAQEIVRRHAEESEQPFMVNRWLGGTMTNFQTIRRSIRRMENIERMEKDGTLDKLKKKERLVRMREHQKLEDVLGGIRSMPRLPGALFVVDVKRENIAVSEANKLGIPIIAMVDTNCDPNLIDFPIPANDDALSSIELVTSVIAASVQKGREMHRAKEQAKEQAKKEKSKS